MKTIVIVYAISWLSLFVVYLISMYENRKSKKMSKTLKAFLNSQKSRRDKIIDKLLYVILIVFAPLVVFVIPYAVVKHVKSKKEARIREEEERKSEQEYERHKTECSENYSKWANSKNNSCGKDYNSLTVFKISFKIGRMLFKRQNRITVGISIYFCANVGNPECQLTFC